MSVRVRVAPSPTGDPHVGTAYIAMLNYCMARRHGGSFVLRIEDTDRSRCSPGSQQAILESLAWLGLDPDEGPAQGGEHGPYTQSERKDAGIYDREIARLLDAGHAYRCFCSPERLAGVRAAQEAAGERTMYDRHCRELAPAEAERRAAAGEAHVVRMKAPLSGECSFTDRLRRQPIVQPWAEVDDQVLIKTDGWPTYHFAAVVDDHHMGITHVIRAEEWIKSVPKHLWLYEHLGWEPPELIHVGLLRNADRSKISKRKNPTDLLWYRKHGYLPGALVNFLALIGHSHPDGREIFGLDELVRVFDLDRLSVGGPVFDRQKLRHVQGQWFRSQSDAEMSAAIHRDIDARLAELLPLLRERMTFGGDFTFLADFFFASEVAPTAADLMPKKWDAGQTRAALDGLAARLRKKLKKDRAFVWDAECIEAAVRDFAAEKNYKPKDFFMTVRVALSGRRTSPPLFDTMAVLGQQATLERLGAAVLKLRDA